MITLPADPHRQLRTPRRALLLPMPVSRRSVRSRRLYRLGVTASLISFGVGSWRLFVERDVIGGIFWQVIFPLLVLRLSLTLYRRSSRL